MYDFWHFSNYQTFFQYPHLILIKNIIQLTFYDHHVALGSRDSDKLVALEFWIPGSFYSNLYYFKPVGDSGYYLFKYRNLNHRL